MLNILTKITTMPYLMPIIIASVLMFSAATIILFTTRKQFVRLASTIMLVLITIFTASILSIYAEATHHGATDEDLQEMPISEIVARTLHSHQESDLTETDIENLKDCYIMYYKFSCNDCLETYDDFQEFLKDNDPGVPIYYIASKSEIGKKLLGKYGIAEVPGLVYIYPNGVTFLGKVIYYRDQSTNRAMFNNDIVLELYEFRKDLLALEQP